MNKSNKIIAWLMGGAAAIGAALGGGYYASRTSDAPQAQTAEAPAPAAEAPAPAAEAPAPAAEAPAAEAPAVKTGEAVVDSDLPEAADAAGAAGTPTFDVLRVEKDGSAVVAGSAGPDTKVDLMSAGQVIGTAQSGPTGDFAIVLDKPLAPGAHELSLRTTDAAGASVTSDETGVVNLPQDGSELVAMVTKPGEASRVMQAGEDTAAQTQVAATEPAAAPAADAAAPAADAAAPAADAAMETAAAPAADASAPAETAVAPEPPVTDGGKPVLLSAVDYEDGKIYVAGTGEPGRAVNIYIDGQLTGSTKVGPDGSYLLEAPSVLVPGSHTIRADQLSGDTAQVAARAEAPLVHEAPVAVAENAVKPAEPAATTIETPAAIAPSADAPAAAASDAPAVTVEAPAAATAEAPAATAPAAEAPAAATTETAAVAASTEAPAAATAEAPAAAGTEAPAQEVAAIKTGASVIIRRGDNLWRISRRMLGKGIRYTTIYEANRDQIKNPRLIYPGQVFQVPGGQENVQ